MYYKFRQYYRKFKMRRRNSLYSIVASLAIVAITTVIMLSILGITASVSYASTITQPTLKAQTPNITVYRSPECTCCGGWIKHLKTEGFSVQDFLTSDIEAVKQKLQVPDNLTSCHTAMIDGYVIEGHVPANDIKRLLEKKSNISGLSVPNMPVGTPGMEMGDKKDPFSVLSFDNKNRIAVFNQYLSS